MIVSKYTVTVTLLDHIVLLGDLGSTFCILHTTLSREGYFRVSTSLILILIFLCDMPTYPFLFLSTSDPLDIALFSHTYKRIYIKRLHLHHMPELTRAELKAAELRQRMAMVSTETVGVQKVVAQKDDQSTFALEQKINTLKGAKTKIVHGYEQQLKEKDFKIMELQAQVSRPEELEAKNKELEVTIKEKDAEIASLKVVEKENEQLKGDLEHLRKKAEYDQKVLQEAISAADAKLSAKLEENNRLNTKLAALLTKLEVRSKMSKALSELDNDIAKLNTDMPAVPDSHKMMYQDCDAFDVEMIKETLSSHLHTEKRDDHPAQEAEVDVDTPMKQLARVMACGATFPLSAE